MSKPVDCKTCSKIESLYLQISKLTDLSPSTKVNNLFSELVSLAISDSNKHVLSIKKLDHLQKICNLAEFELEKYWANKIINNTNPKKDLIKFPYYQNYLDLTKLEYYSIRGCGNHNTHKYIFIGGGPLPMTAIVLAIEYGAEITVLDYDVSACNISTELVSKLGLEKQIKVINRDGSTFDDYDKFDVIFVAALAGIDSNIKSRILKQIKENAKKDTHVLARSAWGNRRLLYKPLDRKMYDTFMPVVEVHPQNHIVNSIIIMKT